MARKDRPADPARTLALLWRDHQEPAPRTRGPKQQLTFGRIVDTAIAVADAEGLDTLAMRKVAEPLGVSTMSLYTYVHGRAELVNCMLDEVLSEAVSLSGVENDWRAALELYANGIRDIARRHPWMPPLFGSRMLMGPHETALWDGVLRAVAGTGLTEPDMLAVVNLVNGYVRGAMVQEADALQDERRTGLSHQEWFERSGPVLERLIPFTRYPTLTRVWMTGVFEEPGAGFGHDGGFDFGLQRVLDGIAAHIAEHAGAGGPAPVQQLSGISPDRDPTLSPQTDRDVSPS